MSQSEDEPIGGEPESHGDQSASGGGFLHTLPMYVDEEFLDAEFIYRLLTRDAPALLGVAGHPAHDPTHRKIVISYEWPIPYLFVLGSATLVKPDLERFHLDQYCTDHLLATGRLPYASEPTAAEPPSPDFVFDEPLGRVGVDSVQFPVPGRRNAHGWFKTIRRAITRQPRHRFTQLAGMMIYAWFPQGDRLGLAYKATMQQAALNDAVDALAAYRPDRSLPWIEGEGLPDPHPGLGAVTIGGCTFYGVPLEEVPPTPFYTKTGFELGMAYGTSHDAASGWDALSKLTEGHDKTGYDHLLVTVGGPDRDGLGYLAEEVLIAEMLREPTRLAKPGHLSKVVFHFWETGRITEVA